MYTFAFVAKRVDLKRSVWTHRGGTLPARCMRQRPRALRMQAHSTIEQAQTRPICLRYRMYACAQLPVYSMRRGDLAPCVARQPKLCRRRSPVCRCALLSRLHLISRRNMQSTSTKHHPMAQSELLLHATRLAVAFGSSEVNAGREQLDNLQLDAAIASRRPQHLTIKHGCMALPGGWQVVCWACDKSAELTSVGVFASLQLMTLCKTALQGSVTSVSSSLQPLLIALEV